MTEHVITNVAGGKSICLKKENFPDTGKTASCTLYHKFPSRDWWQTFQIPDTASKTLQVVPTLPGRHTYLIKFTEKLIAKQGRSLTYTK